MTLIERKTDPPDAKRRTLHRDARAAALALAALALSAALSAHRELPQVPAPAPQAGRSEITVLPADEVDTGSTLLKLPGGANTAIAWSPDGRTLAFIGVKGGVRQVYLRDLEGGSARPVEGTAGARHLAFSPDGRWLAFWANGQVLKVAVDGGPAVKMCDAPSINGLAWGQTRFVYATMRQLFEVSSEGGAARALGDATGRVASPHLLPGDTAVLYTAYQKNWTSGDERVMALPLTPGGTPKVLVPEAADARYLPTGHLAFLRQGTLVVAPFDVKTLTLAGDEVPVLKNVAQTVATWNAMDLTLAGQWTISAAGTLAYVANPTPSFPGSELVAVDRAGHVTPLGAPVNTYREHIEPSPDGSRVVMSIQTEKEVGLSVYDVARGALTPLLAAPDNSETIQPIWSKRGRIAAMVIKGGTTELVLFDAHSPSNLEVVANSAYFSPGSWSPDGQSLIGVLAGDIWVYSGTAQEQQLAPLTQTPANEAFPALSPDGRWLAYTSNASGREEVYVQPYPGPGKAIQVSSAGGRSPAWNPQGGELFYAELPQAGGPDWRLKQAAGPDWRMMSVDMTVPGSPGKPKALFAYQPASLPLASCSPINCYSVAPNGRQFYTQRMLPRAPAPVTHIRLVRNWLEEVKAKAPAK